MKKILTLSLAGLLFSLPVLASDDIDLKGNVNKYYIEKGNLKLENGTLKKG